MSESSRLDHEKLAGVLGLLQSAHDPEVVTAARHAVRMLREAGTTWRELLGVGDHDPDVFGRSQVLTHPELGPLAPPVGRLWKDTLRWLCQRRAGADPRENERLDDLGRRLAAQYGYTKPFLSPYEAAWVMTIYRRIAGPETGAAADLGAE